MPSYPFSLRPGAQTRLGLLCLILLAGCTPGTTPRSDAPSDRPNILFIMADDHDSAAISAYGEHLARTAPTPHIDRLAHEGMLFRHAMVTNSICGPSRAVLLTGKHSHLNGFLDNQRSVFDSTQTTFPMLLRRAGYQTAIVGKWHLVSQPAGFDYWRILPGQGDYYDPRFLTPEGPITEQGYVTDVITDRAIEWLRDGRDPARPFLLMLHHKAPHRAWLAAPETMDLFRGETIPEPPTLFDTNAGRASGARTQEMTIAGHMTEGIDLKVPDGERWDALQRQMPAPAMKRMMEAYREENERYPSLTGAERTRWRYQRYMKDYLRTIRSVDENVGRVLDYLDEAGLTRNTIVVYTSDQGFFLGEHGWFDKRWMYEESLHTPLLVRWPGRVAPGAENTDLVHNLDFAQTLLDGAGVAPPADMQGRSLIPLLKGRTPPDWRTSVYYHYYEYPGPHSVPRHYGVRTERYKLIHYYELGEWELFDLHTDPDERTSVYDDPRYARIREELLAEMNRLRTLYRVPDTDPLPFRGR